MIQERDANNNPLVAYTRGTDLSGTMEGAGGIGGLLARTIGYSCGSGNWSTHHYYHADGNGNVTKMVDGSQSAVASYRYDPFGNLVSSSGVAANDNVYRFSSKEFHVASGMYYYLYRFYDPNLQRWINRDPLADQGFNVRVDDSGISPSESPAVPVTITIGDWNSANTYRSSCNAPVDCVDAFGLYSAKECFDICGSFVSGAAQGLAAAADGALPIFNPFAAMGAYDPNDPTLKASKTCGAVASCALGTAGALRGAAALGGTRACRVLNSNRYLRIGPGRFGGDMVPRISIGNGPASGWNHLDLRFFGW